MYVRFGGMTNKKTGSKSNWIAMVQISRTKMSLLNMICISARVMQINKCKREFMFIAKQVNFNGDNMVHLLFHKQYSYCFINSSSRYKLFNKHKLDFP